jgi:hypothetical protein
MARRRHGRYWVWPRRMILFWRHFLGCPNFDRHWTWRYG